MKTWALIWYLVFPPAGPNQDVTWEAGIQGDLTESVCRSTQVEEELNYEHKLANGDIVGFEIYCKDTSDENLGQANP